MHTRRSPRRPARPMVGHVEPLERRDVPATLVAIGSEIGVSSRPLISLVDAETGVVAAQTLAYEATFRGGVRVAMGDVDANGILEVITAPGPGRMGEVRVFTPVTSGGTTTLSELVGYRTLPFGEGHRGGVDVASGDVDGDLRDDIVAVASRGNGQVRVFRTVAAADPVVDAPLLAFSAFAPTFNGGGSVAVADVGTFADGRLVDAATPDGKVEIVIGSGAGMPPVVRIYDVSAAPRVADSITPLTSTLQGGVAVASGRFNADLLDDVIVSAGRGGGGATEVYDGRVAAAANPRLARFAAFTGLARPNAPAFVAGIDRNGDGRIDGFVGTQGDAGGTAGIAGLSQAGGRTGLFSSLVGPLRVAAPRTAYQFVTTPSGLQYRDLKVGTGVTPTVGQRVTAHYTGWLIDGTKFDSSRDRGTPFEFTLGVGQVIAGWDEGIATMRVGGRRTMVIPANLAYGSTPRPGIPANSTLVFDVELLAVT